MKTKSTTAEKRRLMVVQGLERLEALADRMEMSNWFMEEALKRMGPKDKVACKNVCIQFMGVFKKRNFAQALKAMDEFNSVFQALGRRKRK